MEIVLRKMFYIASSKDKENIKWVIVDIKVNYKLNFELIFKAQSWYY